jgi:F-type H+-transporting ATPase subunit delta
VTALTEIRAAFVELYREDKGIKTLHFTSAIPVSQDVKEDILRRMQSMPRYQKYTLILEEKIDETIIGGFVLQIEDELFDASIRNDLDYIKKQFVENMYIQRIR